MSNKEFPTPKYSRPSYALSLIIGDSLLDIGYSVFFLPKTQWPSSPVTPGGIYSGIADGLCPRKAGLSWTKAWARFTYIVI